MAILKSGEIVESSADALRLRFEAFLAGDNAAFLELYRELNPRLSAYCHKLSPATADDLMQELWERVIALRRRSTLRNVLNPSAFLFRMLKNLSVDEHRKTKDAVPLDESTAASLAVEFSSEETGLETLAIEAFDMLPLSDREILALNIYSGYSFGEIAEMLEKSPEAVWQHASRARVKLRSIVIDQAARRGISLPPIKGTTKGTIKKKGTFA